MTQPIALDGINGGVFLTHSCRFRCLPDSNDLNKGYYSKGIITLLSTGYLQRHGCSYKSNTSDTSRMSVSIFLPNGELFDNPSLSDNNLLPISDQVLARTCFSSNPTTRLRAYISRSRSTPTSEQLKRCDDVERELHRLSFPTDESFINDLQHGKIHWASHLTAADVKLNRELRGPCPHQHARNKLFTNGSSDSPPATQPGQVVQFDIQLLFVPFPGGYTHEIYFLDEYSRHFDSELALSKSNTDILRAINNYKAKNFTTNNFRLQSLHGDYEAINKSLLIPLATMGIKLHLSKPGRHVTRLERFVQTMAGRMTSIKSSLPYVLPSKLDPLLRKSVMYTMNNSLHSNSTETPNEILHGSNYNTVPIPFGSVHLVTQLPAKRNLQANSTNESKKYVPTTEIGVCVGPNLLTKSFDFLTYGGHIGPKASTIQLSSQFVPFNFIPKDYLPFTKLPKYINNKPISLTNNLNLLRNPDIYSEPPPGLQQPHNEISGHQSITFTDTPNPDNITDSPATQLSTKSPSTAMFDKTNSDQPRDSPFVRLSSRTIKPVQRLGFDNPNAFTAMISTIQNTLTRKYNNARVASARNRAYRNTLDVGDLNNNPTDIIPSPLPRNIRVEVNSKEAFKKWGFDKVKAGEDKELKKILETYTSYKPISNKDVQPDAIFIPSMALYKEKRDGTVTCRIPGNGKNQPPDSYGPTHALTTDTTDSLFLLSTALKEAFDTGTLNDLIEFSAVCDVPAGFINGIKRDLKATGFRQLITKLPTSLLNNQLAGKLCEIIGPQYGLVDSNYLFDQNINKVHTDIFNSNDVNPRIYFKWHENRFIFIRLYVDDSQILSNSKFLRDQYKHLMFKRYGPDLSWKDGLAGITGLEYNINSNKSVTVTVNQYLLKLLHEAGMDNVPPAITPSLGGLFDTDPDSPKLSIKDADEFRTVNGALIWPLPVRADFQKEVRFLCSRNSNPTIQDRSKQIQLLRYIKGFPNIGPTFTGDCDSKPGVRINGASDAAHAVHPITGASQLSYLVKVGDKNAPFDSYCGAEKGVISPEPMSAEYTCLNKCAKKCLQWRQFANILGFPSSEPSKIRQDNNSAINLVKAPQVSRKSRWLLIKHHFVRSLYKEKLIDPIYTNTNEMGDVDMGTKSQKQESVNQFLHNRACLFNTI